MFVYSRRKIARLMGLDYLGAGLVGQAMGTVLTAAAWGTDQRTPGAIGNLLLVLGTGVLLGGCGIYARYHRLSRWWGLLGVFSVVGVLILLVLPLISRERKYGPGFGVMFAEPYRRDVWRMDVRVTLDQNVGTAVREPILLQLPRGANVGTAMKTLAGVIPELDSGELPAARFAINGQPADRRTELSHGDELAVCATIAEGARE
ncbi:MAG: hypothetical protein ABSB74_09245 [Tepidisphaeraceae bacterium]